MDSTEAGVINYLTERLEGNKDGSGFDFRDADKVRLLVSSSGIREALEVLEGTAAASRTHWLVVRVAIGRIAELLPEEIAIQTLIRIMRSPGDDVKLIDGTNALRRIKRPEVWEFLMDTAASFEVRDRMGPVLKYLGEYGDRTATLLVLEYLRFVDPETKDALVAGNLLTSRDVVPALGNLEDPVAVLYLERLAKEVLRSSVSNLLLDELASNSGSNESLWGPFVSSIKALQKCGMTSATLFALDAVKDSKNQHVVKARDRFLEARSEGKVKRFTRMELEKMEADARTAFKGSRWGEKLEKRMDLRRRIVERQTAGRGGIRL